MFSVLLHTEREILSTVDIIPDIILPNLGTSRIGALEMGPVCTPACVAPEIDGNSVIQPIGDKVELNENWPVCVLPLPA